MTGIGGMLLLLFYLGEDMYAVDCKRVRELSPMAALKTLPHAPDYLAGLFHYRRIIVAVSDLGRMILGSSCRMRLSTRIILVERPEAGEGPPLLGLIAEKVTDIIEKPPVAFASANLCKNGFPCFGGIIMEKNRMIQLIDVESMFERLKIMNLSQHRKTT